MLSFGTKREPKFSTYIWVSVITVDLNIAVNSKMYRMIVGQFIPRPPISLEKYKMEGIPWAEQYMEREEDLLEEEDHQAATAPNPAATPALSTSASKYELNRSLSFSDSVSSVAPFFSSSNVRSSPAHLPTSN